MSQTGQTESDPAAAAVQLGFNVPAMYMNGFNTTASLTDVTTFVLWNNRPQAILTMPLPMAKTYAMQLLEMIKTIEDQTRQTILSVQELGQMQEQQSRDGT